MDSPWPKGLKWLSFGTYRDPEFCIVDRECGFGSTVQDYIVQYCDIGHFSTLSGVDCGFNSMSAF